MNLNKAIIAGNITANPELRTLPSGVNVVNFCVAVNRTWKDNNGTKQEDTEFANIVAFDKRGEVIERYLKKGDPIYIEGRMQTRSWEKDGEKKYRTEIIMTDFQFVGRREEEKKDDYPTQQTEGINTDDIPFGDEG